MKDLNFLKYNLIAHRGFHNAAIVENTTDAFREAIKRGFSIEFDVHLLKDGNIVVFHDDNLKRLTKIDKNIKDLTIDEVNKIKLLNSDAHIPSLEEVLKLIGGKVPILIELKYDNKLGKLEKRLVNYLDNYDGLFAVQSFNPLIINWFRKHRPEYIRGLLLSSKRKLVNNFCKTNLIYRICKPDFISYDYKLYKDRIIKRNVLRLCWTIKTNDDFKKYRNYFDNLICENIDTFRINEDSFDA